MLLIAGRYQSLFAALGLNSFDSIAAAFGAEEPPRKTGVFVKPRMLGGGSQGPVAIFYKQYFHQPPSFSFLWRPSKARCEYNNYAAFAALGIRSADAIACAEKRDRVGRLCSAFIITRAIPDSTDLIDFMTRRCPANTTVANARSRRSVIRQLAAMARAIHGVDFFHHDLVWRNILVNIDPVAGPQVWWIDCPRGRFDRWSPWRRRRLLKDLASLDKCGSQYCTRSERLDFAKTYLGKKSLDAETLTLARDVTRYRRERWPEDWHGR